MLYEVAEALDEVELVGAVEADRRDAERERLDAPLGARLTVLESMAPGPELAAELLKLSDTAVTTHGKIRLAALWTRVVSWTHAQSIRALADPLSPTGRLDQVDELVATDLALCTHISEGSATNQAALVQRVRVQLAAGWEALHDGAITLAHLRALDEAVRHCPRKVAARVDAHIVPRCIQAGWTPAQLKRAAAEAVIVTDPAGAKDRADAAKRHGSDVTFRAGEDELASIEAIGDAATMRAVMDRIDRHADTLPREDPGGQPTSIGLRRITALAELILGTRAGGKPNVEVVLTLDLDTWLGLNARPGDVSGYGPITADTARKLARDGALRRLILDPLTGKALDLGRHTYRPSKALLRFIAARDRTCRFPGCTRRATHCDTDHILADSAGGLTEPHNLHTLCRKHHEYKTKRKWRVDVHPDGSETWTSPFGFQRHKPPPTYRRDLIEPCDETDEPLDDSVTPLSFHDHIATLRPASQADIDPDTGWFSIEPPEWIHDDADTDDSDTINTDALDAYLNQYYAETSGAPSIRARATDSKDPPPALSPRGAGDAALGAGQSDQPGGGDVVTAAHAAPIATGC